MKGYSTLSKVMKRISKYSVILALSLLLALVSVALTLYLPILFGNAIDLITDTNVELAGILPILTKAALIIALTALAQWLMNCFNNKITFNILFILTPTISTICNFKTNQVLIILTPSYGLFCFFGDLLYPLVNGGVLGETETF